MSEYVASGVVTAGRLKVRNWSGLTRALARFRDGEVVITIARRRATRSAQANAYYWSQVVGLVADHTGHTPDEIHEIYKAKFLPKRLSFADGNGVVVGEFVIGGTTTRLTKTEFYEYVEQIRLWAAEELGVVIPDPDQDWMMADTTDRSAA